MNRIHSTLIAALIGAAATAGLYAAAHTVRLGQNVSASHVSARDLASRHAKLAAWRRSLDAARAKRPPALPKLPHFGPVSTQSSVATAQPHLTYVQAPTVVKYEHAAEPATTATTSSSSDGESSDESGDDSGGDDG